MKPDKLTVYEVFQRERRYTVHCTSGLTSGMKKSNGSRFGRTLSARPKHVLRLKHTPRDVVQLLVQLVFADVEDTLKKSKGTLVAIYDPAVGTGGMVTVAKE